MLFLLSQWRNLYAATMNADPWGSAGNHVYVTHCDYVWGPHIKSGLLSLLKQQLSLDDQSPQDKIDQTNTTTKGINTIM